MLNKIFYLSIFALIFTLGLILLSFGTLTKSYASETIYIESESDLINFAERVNSGEVFLNAVLTSDITITSNFDYIGKRVIVDGEILSGYSGVFDGNYHTISGLNFSSGGLNGLFGYTDGATISNLIVSSTVDISSMASTAYIGGVIASAVNTTVNNCAIYLTVSGESNARTLIGGVFGVDTSTERTPNNIENCIVYFENYAYEGSKSLYIDSVTAQTSQTEPKITNSLFYQNFNSISYSSTTSCFHNFENKCLNDSCAFIPTENMSLCSNCGLYYLNFDSSHTNAVKKTEITPTLKTNVYDYSPNGIKLEFNEINKTDLNHDVSFSYEIDDINTGARSAKVTLIGDDAEKYTLTTDTVYFTISPLNVYIDIENTTSIYGETLSTPKYTISNSNVEVSFSYKKNGVATNLFDVGVYEIVPSVADKNYLLINQNSATYTITPAKISLVEKSFTHTFDNTTYKPNLILNGVLDKDKNEVNYQFLDTLPTNFGTYSAKIELIGERAYNYELLDSNIEINISPKPITVIWNKTSLIFNNDYQSPLATLDTGIANYSLNNVSYSGKGKDVGEYTILCSISDKNFILENNSLKYEILPFELKLEYENLSFTFDNKEHLPSYSYTLPFDYKFSITESAKNKFAGDYTATFESLDKNIEILNPNCAYSIIARDVSVNFTNTMVEFDNTTQFPNYSLDCEIDDYEIKVIENGICIDADTYDVSVTSNDKNINLINNKTSFTILPYEITLDYFDTEVAFCNDYVLPKFNFTAPYFAPNLPITLTCAQKDVGQYVANAVLLNKNFSITNPEIIFVIIPFKASVVWTNTTHIFDNENFAPSASVDLPFEYNLEIIVSGSAINAGKYSANATTSDKNIILENTTCNYEISPRKVELSWGDLTFTYSGYPIVPNYTFDDFGYNFSIDLTTSGIDVGEHTAVAKCNNINIELVNSTAKYKILPLEISVIWENTTFTYDGLYKVPSVIVDTADITINPNCIPSLFVSGGATETGTFTATASTLNNNFILLNDTCEFTILPCTMVIENDNSDISVMISGEINTSQVEASFIDTEGLTEMLPEGYIIYFAIDLNSTTLEFGDVSDLNVSISLPILFQNFDIFLITDTVTKIDYTTLDSNLNFVMSDYGIICLALQNNTSDNINIAYVIAGSICGLILLIPIIVLICRKIKNSKTILITIRDGH